MGGFAEVNNQVPALPGPGPPTWRVFGMEEQNAHDIALRTVESAQKLRRPGGSRSGASRPCHAAEYVAVFFLDGDTQVNQGHRKPRALVKSLAGIVGSAQIKACREGTMPVVQKQRRPQHQF